MVMFGCQLEGTSSQQLAANFVDWLPLDSPRHAIGNCSGTLKGILEIIHLAFPRVNKRTSRRAASIA
jgi:hypothetical protein